MTQSTARVPDELVAEIDRAAKALKRSCADIVRQAVEYYLEDLEGLARGLEALRDPRRSGSRMERGEGGGARRAGLERRERMSYTVRVKSSALEELKKLELQDRRRLVEATDRHAEEPHAGGLLKGEFGGLRSASGVPHRQRLRTGAHGPGGPGGPPPRGVSVRTAALGV